MTTRRKTSTIVSGAAGAPGSGNASPMSPATSAAAGACDASGPLDAYIACLGALAASRLPELRQAWPLERVRQACIRLANTWGIPPELLYGAMLQESGGRPVGIFSGSVSAAQAKRSSAFGMSQVTRTRYKQEAKLLGEPWASAPHSVLIDPELALGYMAASYNRGFATKGGDRSKVPPWAGAWWAGGSTAGEGAQRKQKYILAHGAEVWTPQGANV